MIIRPYSSAEGGFYLALAVELGATVVTADRRWAHALQPGPFAPPLTAAVSIVRTGVSVPLQPAAIDYAIATFAWRGRLSHRRHEKPSLRLPSGL
jgi:predicted nucleic acid-binding protein